MEFPAASGKGKAVKRGRTDIASKTAVTGIGGAVAVLLVWGLSLAGVEIPDAVVAALTTLLAFGASYATEEK